MVAACCSTWAAGDDSEWEFQKDRFGVGCEGKPFPAGQALWLLARVSITLPLHSFPFIVHVSWTTFFSTGSNLVNKGNHSYTQRVPLKIRRLEFLCVWLQPHAKHCCPQFTRNSSLSHNGPLCFPVLRPTPGGGLGKTAHPHEEPGARW